MKKIEIDHLVSFKLLTIITCQGYIRKVTQKIRRRFIPSWSPMSDIVFCDTHNISTIFHLMQYYRDIFTIFSKCKLGLNAPKFHFWSAYVEIFATKWPIYGIFIIKHHTWRFFLHSNAIKGFLLQGPFRLFSVNSG